MYFLKFMAPKSYFKHFDLIVSFSRSSLLWTFYKFIQPFKNKHVRKKACHRTTYVLHVLSHMLVIKLYQYCYTRDFYDSTVDLPQDLK